ncbi:UDP-N-acetylglucosamine--undecaprenyl-phosphate N-acetylglucosaminephosphotransferase [Thalassotalea marina]|nr:UDP-N-acetylglucosamine--undecaprenyl-phosphate N-acetylglucosaminephosphotransferase [Thalassotalea marina]
MIETLSALFVTFVVSIATIKILLPLAPQIGLVDLPNARKKHDGAIPLIGGISIYTGVLIASTFFLEQSQLFNLYFISSALLVFIGTMDDIYDLKVAPRLIFQGLVATIMVFGAGIYIHDFGNIFMTGNVDIGSYGMLFTILACIACINAYNMIDGIDGLAGSMSIVTIASVAILTFLNDTTADLLLPMILIVATIPYLFYNVSTRNPRGKKIFMGDAGSMFIGLTVIWLLVVGTQETYIGKPSFNAVTALWIIAIPIMDMLAIMIRRVVNGDSPFKADNGHIHHLLLRIGMKSRKALWNISTLSIAFALIGILGEYKNVHESIMLIAFLCILSIYCLVSIFAWRFVEHKDRNLLASK